MIIAPVDNSDAASATNTLVTKDSDKMPRFFAVLTYASLGMSIVPFIFSLMLVTTSQLNTLPTIIAYVFTMPFHVAALLIIWQHSRQIDMQLPFRPSSGRSITYIGFLAAMWLFSMITCAMGASSSLSSQGQIFGASTGLAALEMLILSTITVLCYRNRPRKESLPTSIRVSPVPSPKVVSV